MPATTKQIWGGKIMLNSYFKRIDQNQKCKCIGCGYEFNEGETAFEITQKDERLEKLKVYLCEGCGIYLEKSLNKTYVDFK